MEILLSIAIFLIAYLGMEFIAWFTHKYIMHGFLWSLHQDHHKKDTYGFFERNDFFFLIFAIPGIALIMTGLNFSVYLLAAGSGITAYGFSYFLVHDVFIHRRLPFLKKLDHPYFRAIRKAHLVHHKVLTKEGASCFGMLWVPLKFFRESKR